MSSPAVPVRRFMALAFADEVLAHPGLLRAYAASFGAGDPATLVVYAPDADERALEAELAPLVAAAGLDGEEGAEVLALAIPRDAREEERLAAGVDCLLSARLPRGAFRWLLRVDASSNGLLRALAEERWLRQDELVVLCYGRELLARPELRDLVAHVAGGGPVRLLVHAEADERERIETLLRDATVPATVTEDAAEALVETVGCVVTERPASDELWALPRVRPDDAPALRELAERAWSGMLAPELERRRASWQRKRRDMLALRTLMERTLGPTSNVLDIGCHDGSVLADAVRLAPHGLHVAYEPLPEIADWLSRTFPGCAIRCAAASDADGEAEFVRVRGNPGMSGFLPHPHAHDLPQETLHVRTERLDAALPPDYVPALIKIDVEGAERQVLEGALETIRRHRPLVVFEHGRAALQHGTAPEDVYELLCDRGGLRIWDLDGRGPYTREEFAETVDAGAIRNWAAAPERPPLAVGEHARGLVLRSPPRRQATEVVFVHIPKTAGSAFRKLLQQVYEPHWETLFDDEAGSELERFVQKVGRPPRVLTGHLPASVLLPRAPDARSIVWLREPVSRVISTYFYWKSLPDEPDPRHAGIRSGETTLLDFATQHANGYARYWLAGYELEDLDFVGVVEHADEDVRAAGQLFGWGDVRLESVNRTTTPEYLSFDRSSELVERIRRLNDLDTALYERALELRAERLKV